MVEINKIYCVDCIEGMKLIEDNSIDSIVTDPPYELGFMGKSWDSSGIAYNIEMWKEAYRILKPGGHLLAFGGTRTYHRMACAIEDAGFEIRDQIQWIYGSGFPKSLNIGKAIDKLQGNEREVVYNNPYADGHIRKATGNISDADDNVKFLSEYKLENGLRKDTKGNSKWEGWGTALKPANEPICVARKPLSEKSVAENVLKWGTGGINIDACRIGLGRFPANVILDEEAGKILDEQAPQVGAFAPVKSGQKGFGGIIYGKYKNSGDDGKTFYENKLSGASRFFYCAKASKSERNQGLDDTEETINCDRNPDCYSADVPFNRSANPKKNNHPTVKPIKLMEYLVKLVTPKKGIVLDPFMGSGTTGMAAKSQGFNYIGFDMTEEYCKIAEARINSIEIQKKLLEE